MESSLKKRTVKFVGERSSYTLS